MSKTKTITRTDLSFLRVGTNYKNQCFIEIVYKDLSSTFGLLRKKFYEVEFAGSPLSHREDSEWSYEGKNSTKDFEELEWLFSMCYRIESLERPVP